MSRSAFDKKSQSSSIKELISFKESMEKSMAFSMKDSIIIFLISLLMVGGVVATVYLKPMEWFTIVPVEDLQAMVQESLKSGTVLEMYKKLILESWKSGYINEWWNAVQWRDVYAFLLVIPNALWGCLFILFPAFLVLYILVTCDLKEMIAQLEKSLEQQDKPDISHDVS
ncbi:hypothetical protein [Bartonella doshiae]|uniref:hypothetical protein n=1 Tax=Bartonella doshiae TaxID=33044 RepID=UPI0009425866|nr:hypothetical protein [Bartonella doshiae]